MESGAKYDKILDVLLDAIRQQEKIEAGERFVALESGEDKIERKSERKTFSAYYYVK